MISSTEARLRAIETRLALLDTWQRLRAGQLRAVEQNLRDGTGQGSGGGGGFVGKVTTAPGAATSGNYTSGICTIQKLNSGAFADDVTGITFYNMTDRDFVTGAFIALTMRYGVLWVDDVDTCTHLA